MRARTRCPVALICLLALLAALADALAHDRLFDYGPIVLAVGLQTWLYWLAFAAVLYGSGRAIGATRKHPARLMGVVLAAAVLAPAIALLLTMGSVDGVLAMNMNGNLVYVNGQYQWLQMLDWMRLHAWLDALMAAAMAAVLCWNLVHGRA